MSNSTPEPELPLVAVPDAPLAIAPLQPMELIAQAIAAGTDPQALVTLSELAKEWEDRKARKEFVAAFAKFKERCPPIPKTRWGGKATAAGSPGTYRYAPLEEIARTVDPLLQGLGFTYKWDSVSSETGRILVTCVLSHTGGHAESAAFSCASDSKSPAMSNQQKDGGAMSFGRRYSLTAVLGITTADDDNDGSDEDFSLVTPDQAAHLENLVQEVKANRVGFMKWAVGCEDDVAEFVPFDDVPARKYDQAVRMLEAKRG